MENEPVKYCAVCGYPIPEDAWVIDEKSDREHPSYLHLGCFLTEEEDGKIIRSSN